MTDLLLCYDFPPLGGGIARMMAEVARRYPDRLLVSTGARPGPVDPALESRVDRLPVPADRLRTIWGRMRWGRRVDSLARRHGVGFVWCGNVRPAAPVASRLFRRREVPYGIIFHGGDLFQWRRKFGNPFKHAAAVRWLSEARWLVANSAWTAELIGEVGAELGVALGTRVRVVPLGSDPGRFRPDASVEGLEARYQLAKGRRRLLTVARLVPHKGIDVGIEALGVLAPKYPDLDYLVVGSGPDRARLEARAAEAGLADRVRILSGVPDHDLPGLYRLADVYLGLSREEGLDVEGFGIALADAAASGLPAVAGRSGGTAAAVRDGVTGRRVDPTDVAVVAAVTADLLNDPGRCREFGAEGRRWVETELNWDRVAAALAELSRSAARPVPT